MKTKFICIVITLTLMNLCVNAQNSWQISGNSNITNNNFIGTTNKTAFKIRTNNLVRMTINTNGNVGIGTTTPKSTLDVGGTITGFDSYFGSRFPVSAGTSGASYSSVGYGLTFSDTTANYRYRINNDYSSMLNFRAGGFDFNTAPIGTAGNTIPYTTVMRIEQNGNVGIGTLITTSFNKLTVAGNATFSGNLGIGDPNEKSYKLYVVSNTLNYPAAYIENSQGSRGAEGLYIKAGSNLATGSNYIAFFRPDGTNTGLIQQTSINGVTYASTSDKRLKNIIGTSQKGLADLMKIKIYDYTFKSDRDKKVQTGFMAQELYEIFPQAVSKPRDNNEPADKNPWMVDYGRVTPLIIKSVQEQQQMIDDLKKQNEKLQKQIDELKALMISKGNDNAVNNQTALK